MFRQLSIKITVILILVMGIIMSLFTIYFVGSRSTSMEQELLERGKMAVQTEAKMMEQVLTEAMKSGRFTETELFDESYQPIPGTDPQKYHTRYDRYLDERIQDIEDEYLKDEQVVYAVLADRNGYVPTHHRKSSLPLTGDREKDRVGNRTKRIFNNPVELAAARNREPLLKQVYKRDTGETMWDLAAPVVVNGRHWGAVRLGFSMAKTEEKIAMLRMQIIGSMLCMLLLSSLTIFLVVRRVIRPLHTLTATAGRIAEGELDAEVTVESRDEIGRLAVALNRMTGVIVKNLKEEIGKSSRLFASIREAIFRLSSSAGEMNAIIASQVAGAAQQASAVQEVTTTAEEIAVTARQITANSQTVESMAEATSRNCQTGTDDMVKATEGMTNLRSQVQNIAESMLLLGEHSQKIGGIVEIIDEISDQTNLLALNAAIEAAGAGDAGKRFSIVAAEVRRLAERTVVATRQIKGVVEEIQKATNCTVMVTEEGIKAVDHAAVLVDKARDSFGGILESVDETLRASREIALSTQQQTSACEQLADTMNEVRDVALQGAAGSRETEMAVNELSELAEQMKMLMEEEIEAKGKSAAANGAMAMEQVLADAVATGRLTLADIFDENYQPIPGTDPPKFHTRYDTCFDEMIQDLEDDFLRDCQVVYAVLADRNGYVPTHHRKNSLPLTGDREKDRVGNRTKRMFNNPVELAAARNTSGVLVQNYSRDTGEKLWDISAPVYVNGRHWGAFRVGYVM